MTFRSGYKAPWSNMATTCGFSETSPWKLLAPLTYTKGMIEGSPQSISSRIFGIHYPVMENRFYRFKYLTPRIRLTPADIMSTTLTKPRYIHFICSPQRAEAILREVDELGDDWAPITVYEPIPVRS
jgi:hypothetical protein